MNSIVPVTVETEIVIFVAVAVMCRRVGGGVYCGFILNGEYG